MERTESKATRENIEQFVLSWLVRYKYNVSMVDQGGNGGDDDGCLLQLNHSNTPFSQKLSIMVHDLEEELLNPSRTNVSICPYKYNKLYGQSSILISSVEISAALCPSYVVLRNRPFKSLQRFVLRNTTQTSGIQQRQMAIWGWMRSSGSKVHFSANPLPLYVAVELLEVVLRANTIDESAMTESPHLHGASIRITNPNRPTNNHKDSECANVEIPKLSSRRKKSSDVVPSSSSSSSITKKKKSVFPMPSQNRTRTRSICASMASLIVASSRSKVPIKYTSDPRRHLVGQHPKLKHLHPLMFRQLVPGIDESVIESRIALFRELEGIHAALIHLNILSPRDNWEDWIKNFQSEKDSDPAFMCLLIILMSSSTTDNQLAITIPRLFSSGLTSATAVVDIAKKYGLDCFCTLLSESGRYYQNAERILNAADYFIQQHSGRIPNNIQAIELCTLFGVGYKTANIVITTAFGRVDGIPSDLHVIRWSSILGWSLPNIDGLKCSKMLECWLPKAQWDSINPVFGSFGQLLVSDNRPKLLWLARQHPSPEIRSLFRKAANVYKKSSS